MTEIRDNIEIDFKKEIKFYDLMFSNYFEITNLFNYILNSHDTNEIRIDYNAIYYGINKMYEFGYDYMINKINESTMCIYLNKVDFNNLNSCDLDFIENLLKNKYFDFDLIHKLCQYFNYFKQFDIHNIEYIINLKNLILEYLEYHYHKIIDFYNYKLDDNIYSSIYLQYDNLCINKYKTIFILFLNKYYNDIFSDNKYINIRYHVHSPKLFKI